MSEFQTNVDYLIAGSGFAGSILACCLSNAGYSVCLIEKEQHPRFTIGESSTPIADMILRNLADTYNLPQLKKLSRYGSWQQHFPDVTCGLKRGFSYFSHTKNSLFTSDDHHTGQMFVAASVDDENSDTQWYRPDTDLLFVEMVKNAGVDYLDNCNITDVSKGSDHTWSVAANKNGSHLMISARFIIDATGSSEFSGTFFGTTASSTHFETNTRAIFSHFEDVPEWYSYLKSDKNIPTDAYPYHPDHSALHHLLDEGWLWMLRFNTGLLSAGLVLDGHTQNHKSAADEWNTILSGYPSLKSLFSKGRLAVTPGHLIGTGRLQRRLSSLYGDGWAALHHTGGFVDPLHSTGIAHSLAGVEKLLFILTGTEPGTTDRNKRLFEYQQAFFKELELIDLLVAGCFKSRHHFDIFTAYTMLYFICTIRYEQQRLGGQVPDHFLCADHPEIGNIVRSSYSSLSELLRKEDNLSHEEIQAFVGMIKERIKPFNSVGLMDPSKQNMYEHTAVEI